MWVNLVKPMFFVNPVNLDLRNNNGSCWYRYTVNVGMDCLYHPSMVILGMDYDILYNFCGMVHSRIWFIIYSLWFIVMAILVYQFTTLGQKKCQVSPPCWAAPPLSTGLVPSSSSTAWVFPRWGPSSGWTTRTWPKRRKLRCCWCAPGRWFIEKGTWVEFHGVYAWFGFLWFGFLWVLRI